MGQLWIDYLTLMNSLNTFNRGAVLMSGQHVKRMGNSSSTTPTYNNMIGKQQKPRAKE